MKRQTKAGVPIVPANTNEFATKDYCSYVHTGFYEGNVEFATAEFADGRCNYGSLDVWNLMQTHGDKIFLRYKDILNSEKYTMRNSSYVLPVKSSYKNSVSGIVVDESDSKLTVFIEPTEIIASNNKIQR